MNLRIQVFAFESSNCQDYLEQDNQDIPLLLLEDLFWKKKISNILLKNNITAYLQQDE